MKLSCSVIRDLLPLYAEGMTGAESNALVQEHLQGCEQCRKALQELRTPAPLTPDTDPAPLKQMKATVRRRRRIAVALAVLFSLAAALAAFGLLSAPEYAPTQAVSLQERPDGLVTLRFGEGVTDYTLYREGDPEVGIVWNLTAWSSPFDRILRRGTPPEVVLNPKEEKVAAIYYCPSNGGEDALLYGTAEGGRITLPRLALGYYALTALAAFAVCIVAAGILCRRRKARTVLLDITFAPLAYLTAQLCICGLKSVTYAFLRDFSLILLLSLLLYAALLLLHHGVFLQKKV